MLLIQSHLIQTKNIPGVFLKMKLLYWSAPLALFVWSFFALQTASYVLIGVIVLFEGYLYLSERMGRPKPDLSNWTQEEIEIIKKYHRSLRNPFAAKKLSGLLNGFRLCVIFWLPWLLWNELWVPAGFLVVNFFVTASLSVRLDPIFFLEDAVRKGQRQFSEELSLLQKISEKYPVRKG